MPHWKCLALSASFIAMHLILPRDCLPVYLSRLHSLHAAARVRVHRKRADLLRVPARWRSERRYFGPQIRARNCSPASPGGALPFGGNDVWCGERDANESNTLLCYCITAAVELVHWGNLDIHSCGG